MTGSRLLKCLSMAALLTAPLLGAPCSAEEKVNHGSFVGEAVLKIGPGHREMTLTQPFAYIDPANSRWNVPAKTVVDGASIPQALWSIVGGPYEGPYRQASVIHDYFCVTKTRPWKAVHRMFFHAMLAEGASVKRANMMYYAVYVGGPRWENVVYRNHPPRAFPKPGDKDEIKVDSWTIGFDQNQAKRDILTIDETTSIEEIEALAEKSFKGKKPPAEVRTDLK